jgi:hypothetical protein
MIRSAALASLAATLLLPQVAVAQGKACLTRQELSNLFVFAAPPLVDAAAKKCSSELPAGAFLRTGGRQLAERLRGEATGNDAAIAATFAKLAGEEIPEGISGETLQLLIRDVVAIEFAKDIKAKDCGKIDEVIAALAPLPGRNIGTLMAVLMELGGGGGEAAPFRICPDTRP